MSLSFFDPKSLNHPITEEKQSRITFAFDLDETLVSHVGNKFPFKLTKDDDLIDQHEMVDWFYNRSLVIPVVIRGMNMFHVCHPGFIPLLRYLLSNENVDVCFFSAGKKERNNPLINAIITLVCNGDAEKFEEINARIKRLHYNDLSPVKESEEKQILRKKTYDMDTLDYYKDLRKVGSILENTLLIEDIESNAFPGQEKNLLKTNFSDPAVFYRIAKASVSKPNVADLEQANHLYYLAGLINIMLQMPGNMTEKLVRLQYAKADVIDKSKDEAKAFVSYFPTKLPYHYQLFFMGRELLNKFSDNEIDFFGNHASDVFKKSSRFEPVVYNFFSGVDSDDECEVRKPLAKKRKLG